MFQPPDPFKNESPFPTNLPEPSEISDPVEFAHIPKGRTPFTPILKKLFIICLILGLVLGVILSIGVVKLIKYWGLTDVPTQSDAPTQHK